MSTTNELEVRPTSRLKGWVGRQLEQAQSPHREMKCRPRFGQFENRSPCASGGPDVRTEVKFPPNYVAQIIDKRAAGYPCTPRAHPLSPPPDVFDAHLGGLTLGVGGWTYLRLRELRNTYSPVRIPH